LRAGDGDEVLYSEDVLRVLHDDVSNSSGWIANLALSIILTDEAPRRLTRQHH
jgi:hypothetical protein